MPSPDTSWSLREERKEVTSEVGHRRALLVPTSPMHDADSLGAPEGAIIWTLLEQCLLMICDPKELF